MRTYDCPYCRCSFSEADKSWDVATESGQCPECLEPLRNFPVPTKQETLPPLRSFPVRSKQQEAPPPAPQPTRQEERPAIQQPYPWGSVLTWVLFAFLLGLTTARPTWKSATSIDQSVLGVFFGIVYAVLTAAIVGSWKYFDRAPRSFFGATGNAGLSSVNTWKRISDEEAKKHPLYGVRGWLALFAFSTLLGFLRDLSVVNAEALKAGISLGKLLAADMPETTVMKQWLAIKVLLWLVICWLLFSKHKSFRPVSTCVLLSVWPALALVGTLGATSVPALVPGLGAALISDFISWTIYCAIWVTYLQKSKRVRVTFEHRVTADRDNVASTSQLPSSPGPAITREPVLERQFNDASTETRMRATPSGASGTMSSTQTTANQVAHIPVPSEPNQNTVETYEDRFYEQIAQELDTNTVDKGLWTKAYAQAGGDDQQTRVLYIKARLSRLLAREDARRNAGK